MKRKTVKALIIVGVVVDLCITAFLFVVSIIMLALIGKYKSANIAIEYTQGLIKYLFQNPAFYFWVFVFPLFVLLAANIIGLVFYVKKTSAKENTPTKLDDLSNEQKEALRQELLKDLMKDTQNNKEE